jgi:hypothetical protein
VSGGRWVVGASRSPPRARTRAPALERRRGEGTDRTSPRTIAGHLPVLTGDGAARVAGTALADSPGQPRPPCLNATPPPKAPHRRFTHGSRVPSTPGRRKPSSRLPRCNHEPARGGDRDGGGDPTRG